MRYLYILTFSIFVFSCANKSRDTKPAKVTVEKIDGKYQLKVNDTIFYIKGAGLEFGDIKSLAEHGANSFRTWRTDNGQKTGKEVLDEAHKHGLMVMMGIEVARERHGFDYNDPKAVSEQLERIKKEVLELKDHPALLIWGIGNELNLHYTNPNVWDAVNDISKMIHKVDKNHLTTTSLAGITKEEITLIKEKAPDLDILSVQMYGDLPNLPVLIKEFGWEGPYIVTEWGATGHWEVPITEWNAPIEENSTVKANNYLKRYEKGIASDSLQCLGSYVFLWGHKQERTPTWYGVFLEDGSETASIDVMHYIWNGHYPDNQSPTIKNLRINGKTAYENIIVKEGQKLEASVEMTDIDKDKIIYKWEILTESTDLKDGGDEEKRPPTVSVSRIKQEEGIFLFEAPNKGQYRLFVYGNDGNGNTATANIPFLVQ